MPPSIKCRTCKIAKQSLFIEPVENNDADKKTIYSLRAGVVIVLVAMAVIFW